MQFPPQKEFKLLNKTVDGDTVSDADYNYAKKVYNDFKCPNLGAFNDLYLITDALLLTDVMETFRKNSLDQSRFGLEPVHYYTLPGFSYDAMLRHTRVRIELMSIEHSEIAKMVYTNVRGGLCQVSHRYAKANNKYLPDNDNTEPPYVVHYLNLQQAVANGVLVKKTHRIIAFKQQNWLQSYINFNNEIRKNATTESLKNDAMIRYTRLRIELRSVEHSEIAKLIVQ